MARRRVLVYETERCEEANAAIDKKDKTGSAAGFFDYGKAATSGAKARTGVRNRAIRGTQRSHKQKDKTEVRWKYWVNISKP